MNACKPPTTAKIQLPKDTDVPLDVIIPVEFQGEGLTEEDFEGVFTLKEGCTEPSAEGDPLNPPDPNKPEEEKPKEETAEKEKKATVGEGASINGLFYQRFKFEQTQEDGTKVPAWRIYIIPPMLKASQDGAPQKYELEVATIITEENKTIPGTKKCFQTSNRGKRYSKSASITRVQVSTEGNTTIDARQLIFVSFDKPIDPTQVKDMFRLCDTKNQAYNDNADDLCSGKVAEKVDTFLVVESLNPDADGWVRNPRLDYGIRGIGLTNGTEYELAAQRVGTKNTPIEVPNNALVTIENKMKDDKTLEPVENLSPRPAKVYQELKSLPKPVNPYIIKLDEVS